MFERLSSSRRREIAEAATAGARKGWHGFLWMMKILAPISLATALLQWSGWLAAADFLLGPLMGVLSLPPVAAVPLIVGMLTNLYGAIAAMVVLPLNQGQMTLVAIFLLIAHNLVQEGVIQGQSGLHPFKATVFRLVVATLTVTAVAPFLDLDAAVAGDLAKASSAPPLTVMLGGWVLATLRLSAKIFCIIVVLMTALEVFKALDWIQPVVRCFTPVLKLLGLSPRVGILWSTAVVFGLAYGAAVIVEEARSGAMTKEELESLHLSIGVNHSMVEDPALFMSLGLSPFWLYVPRFLMALAAVRCLTFWQTVVKPRWGTAVDSRQ